MKQSTRKAFKTTSKTSGKSRCLYLVFRKTQAVRPYKVRLPRGLESPCELCDAHFTHCPWSAPQRLAGMSQPSTGAPRPWL